MSKSQTDKMERLQTVLDCYGANASCWPREDQILMTFIERDSQARQLFIEAKALDALLDLPKHFELENESSGDLQQRILADFTEHHKGKKNVVAPFVNWQKTKIPEAFFETNWMTGAALAACFAIGIYLGGIGIGDWTLDPETSFASLSSTAEHLSEIGDFVIGSGFEEELL